MTDGVQVRLMHADESACVAQLHRECITTGFLSQRAPLILDEVYRAMTKNQNAFCVVAVEADSVVIGFVSGCLDTRQFYNTILLRRGWRMLGRCLPLIFSAETARKLWETATYPFRQKQEKVVLPSAELLSMAVDGRQQGKGVGAKLFERFVAEMKARGHGEFCVTAGTQLSAANAFYQKMGCTLAREIEVHGRERSNLYVYRK